MCSPVPKRILILGGTLDARRLARLLAEQGHHSVYSIAGITRKPRLPANVEVRVGGFGGAQGMADFIRSQGIDMVADATHPFAVQISANAVEAARNSNSAYARLERPAWKPTKADNWIPARDIDEAVSLIESGACAFVTTGRKDVAKYAVRTDIRVVARVIEAPMVARPEDWVYVIAVIPFNTEDELDLMRDYEATVVVSKNAGGTADAKLRAARILGLPVIMIERPEKPPATVVTTIDEMVALAAGEGI